jgi:RNAse (barnase) inhibitor barstar
MKEVTLDAAKWKTVSDFYTALFAALGSPSWHGRNFNALRDSITTGQINAVDLPFLVRISSIDELPSEVDKLVRDFCDLIREFRSEGYEVDIACSD